MMTASAIPREMRHLYSGAIREQFERNTRPIIVDDLDVLLSSVVVPKSPIEKINKLLLHVALKTSNASLGIGFDRNLFPVAYACDYDEFSWILATASNFGLIFNDATKILLTFHGWNRADELSKFQPESTQAFVAMSFNNELYNIWEEGFAPALREVGYDPIRVDTKQTNNKIDDKIIADIRKSGLVVADFTEHRGGVYFEAGFAMGLGIPLIWTCREEDMGKAHFDTRQYSHVTWTDTEDLKTKLINRIEATLPNRPRLRSV